LNPLFQPQGVFLRLDGFFTRTVLMNEIAAGRIEVHQMDRLSSEKSSSDKGVVVAPRSLPFPLDHTSAHRAFFFILVSYPAGQVFA